MHDQFTPCQEVFQKVCDEIGMHYEKKGFKYSRSRPKLIYKDSHISLTISFWSSRSNTPGQYINLEILPYLYSLEVIKNKRGRGEKKASSDGLLLGHPYIFRNTLINSERGTVKVKKIYGTELVRFEGNESESVLILSNNCNLYGITIEKFNMILEFIESKIISFINLIKDSEQVKKYISESNRTRLQYIILNQGFLEYIEITFPSEKEEILTLINDKLKELE